MELNIGSAVQNQMQSFNTNGGNATDALSVTKRELNVMLLPLCAARGTKHLSSARQNSA